MIEIDVQVDLQSAELFLRGVNLKAIPVAEVRSLNKVITTVRKVAVSEVHSVRRLKKSAIRKKLQILRASKRNPEARISVSRRAIPLKEYAAKWSGRKGNKRVVVNVTGQRKMLEHAFIIGHIKGREVGHVFERETAAALPIRKMFGPSLGSAVVKPAIKGALRRVIAERWPVVYRREVEYAISKLPRR